MKNKKKWICLIISIAVIIIMLLGIVFGLKLGIKDGGLYIGKSIGTSYAYTIHKDHVVLKKYYGNEDKVVIPSEILGKPVKVIGYECFEYKDELTEVVLNENVEIIDVRAFAECKNLVEVMQGENIKTIGDFAFNSCEELKEVNVSNYLEVISEGAFSECIALKKMIPQENLKYIGEMAFIDSGLEEFVFNRDVEIGGGAFDGTSWMKNQPEEFVIYGDGNLIGYNGTEETIIIPEGIKTINGGCFTGTVAEEIYILDTVETIRDITFINCPNNIKVYIPASVTQVGDIEGRYPINNDDANITIVTTKDSAAHQHAKEHDIPYEIVEKW